jgi:hypothetical protein
MEEMIAKEFEESTNETQAKIYGLAIRVIHSSIKAWLENQKELCNLMKAECVEEEIRIGDKSGYKFTTTSKTGKKVFQRHYIIISEFT